jgi:hypothetical protein
VNAAVSTVTFGAVHISSPFCGFGWASDIGGIYFNVSLAILSVGTADEAVVGNAANSEEGLVGTARSVGPGAAHVSDPAFGGGADLFHGTDVESAQDIVQNGLNHGAADQFGGDGLFYTSTDRANAEAFAKGNPAGGEPAVVGIGLKGGVEGAVQRGLLSRMESFPGTYTVSDWELFNEAASFRLMP